MTLSPRRLLAILAEPAPVAELPQRVRTLLAQQEAESERLIGWVQLGLGLIFASLYLIAPRPVDAAPRSLLEPVPLALATYLAFTLVRLVLSARGRLPGAFVLASILADTALLLGLIWVFHLQYGQPPPFSLKVPTFIYIFVFIALRSLRFDHRYVLAAGLVAAAGWLTLVLMAVSGSGPEVVTRSFVAYVNGNRILLGAEFDKIVAVLMVTVILALAVARARRTLVMAIREQAAAREVGKFLSKGLARTIAGAEMEVEAGLAIEREAAVIFLDIRGFTRYAATVPPADVVTMLTSFHASVVPVVRDHGGVVDKFLGDGVMVTFGALEPSVAAAADAIRALEGLMDAAAEWERAMPAHCHTIGLQVNAAAAAGRVVFATLGSGDRLEYTVIGEAANLAAKLEKHNKAEGTRALTTAATIARAQAQGYAPAVPGAARDLPGRRVAGVEGAIDLVAVRS